MRLYNKKSSNKNLKELTLVAYKENLITINEKYCFFNIGITKEELIYMRLIDNEESNYEGLFCFLELQSNILNINNNIKTIFEWILASINYNQYHFNYNEDKSQIFFYYNTFNRNLGKNEPKKLKLNLTINKNDIFIIKNYDKIKLINEFNEQYNTLITLNDNIINLANRSINNEGFKELCKFELNASILLLDNNKISDISPLNSYKFKNLKQLYLQQNNINDLNPLCNLNFDNLNELRLNHNQINDINPIEYLRINKIEKLWLNDNDICDISVLERVNFQNLTILQLSKNNIKNISVFENVDFQKLIDLDLSNNKINDISIFEKVELNSLEFLNLSFNGIEIISVKKKIFFPKLKKLEINNNNIKEIDIFGRVLLPKLSKINLSKNIIEKININKTLKFNALQEINLTQNKIKEIKYSI